MIKTYLTWILAGALLASVSLNVVQWQGDAAASAPAEHAVDVRALGLTDAQVAQLLEDCEDCSFERDILRAHVEDKRRELAAVLARPEVDSAKAKAIVDELAQLRSRCVQNAIDTMGRVRNVLTPAQVETLAGCCDPERAQ